MLTTRFVICRLRADTALHASAKPEVGRTVYGICEHREQTGLERLAERSLSTAQSDGGP